MLFQDRVEAGKKMAAALRKYAGIAEVVLALPRGGAICAAPIADKLQIPLDLIFTKKITHPHSSEYAVGAVSENGTVILKGESALIDQEWLENEIARQKQEIRRRRHIYLINRPSLPIKDKVIIIVDDGIATGLTMEAAVGSVRKHRPKQIIAAVPVAPPAAVRRLKTEVDEAVVLYQPEQPFFAVGQFYGSFPEVLDEEICRLFR